MTTTVKKITLVNGQDLDKISIHDRGLNYGDGIFETIKIHDSLPLLWEHHWLRIIRGCERLFMDLPDKITLENEVVFLAGRINAGVIKIILTRGTSNRGYKPGRNTEPTRIITAWAGSSAYKQLKEVEIYISNHVIYRDPVLAGIKHLNRLPQVLASLDQENSDKIGVLCDSDGNIIEAVSANLFVLISGRLQTPDLSECGVAGVMREHVLAEAKKLGIETHVGKLVLPSLRIAEDIFLTNSLLGILPVNRFDEKLYKRSPVTEKLMKAIGQDIYYNC